MVNTALLKRVEISASALLHNFGVLRRKLSSGVEICCVLKSNAYGHGFFNVLEILKDEADAFAVIDLSEAYRIRRSGIRKKIINIGFTLAEYSDETVELDVIPHIYRLETLKALAESAEKQGKQVKFFIKVETGMNRCGLKGTELDEIFIFASRHKCLIPLGIVTHFAESDVTDSRLTYLQIERFRELRDRYRKDVDRNDISHAANTAALFLYPDAHFKMIRTGIGLYGMPSSQHVYKAGADELRQVLEFKSRIIHIQELEKGDSVSYGATWKAPGKTRIAIVPVGYADGYFRGLSNNNHVIINDRRAEVVGRICMNCFAVDVTGIEGVGYGSEVCLISRKKESGITPDDIAGRLNTINYEITTAISENIPRMTVE
jgi:alanine racemase